MIGSVFNGIFGFHSSLVYRLIRFLHRLFYGSINIFYFIFNVNIVVISGRYNDTIFGLATFNFLSGFVHSLFGLREKTTVGGFVNFFLYFTGSIIYGLSYISSSFVDGFTGVFQTLVNALTRVV